MRALMLLAIPTVACACGIDRPIAPASERNGAAASYGASEPRANDVARGIALAMRDANIRARVRDAMRASAMTEHKLGLQDFALSPAGREVTTAAALALGVSSAELQGLIAGLPALDFYAPIKAHRLTWRATSNVLVAVTFDPDVETIAAFGPEGDVVTLHLEEAKAESRALLLLHPAEPKGIRDGPQPMVPGDVIQDTGDGAGWSHSVGPGELLITARDGSMSVLGRPASNANASVMVSGVYINHFNIQIGDGWFGDSEMQFHSYAVVLPLYAWVGSGEETPIFEAACSIGSYYRNAVEEDVGYDGLFSLSPGITNIGALPVCADSSNAKYSIRLIEIDGGLNLDDEFGWRFYLSGTYPFGATMNPNVMSFYQQTWYDRSAYLRIQYF